MMYVTATRPQATPRSIGRRCPGGVSHADVAFTMKQYVHTDLEADREVVNTLAELILGGLLITDAIIGQADEPYPADEA